MQTSTNNTVTAKARAFSSETARHAHQFLVSGNEVRVWDSVAGHYTACHVLSASAVRRIVKLCR